MEPRPSYSALSEETPSQGRCLSVYLIHDCCQCHVWASHKLSHIAQACQGALEAMMTVSLPQVCLVLDASGARRLNQCV